MILHKKKEVKKELKKKESPSRLTQRKITSFDGTHIFYMHEKGHLPHTLVFLHGVGSNWTVWKKEIEYFREQGFSILALDLRGHGRSEEPTAFEKYQMPCFCKDVYLILKQENIHKFSFVGHSLGGGIALVYSLMYKTRTPSSTIFVEAPSTYPFTHNHLLNLNSYATHLLRFVAAHAPTRKKNQHLTEVDFSEEGIKRHAHILLHLLHITPLENMVKILDNMEEYVFKNQKRINSTLANLSCPALIIAGKEDTIIPVKYARLIKRIKKDAELKILPGVHHRITLENSSTLNELIHAFLREKNLI